LRVSLTHPFQLLVPCSMYICFFHYYSIPETKIQFY